MTKENFTLNISLTELKAMQEIQQYNEPHLQGSTLEFVFKTDIYKEVREIYIRYSPDKPYKRLLKQGFGEDSIELDAVIDRACYINNNRQIGICIYCTLPDIKKDDYRLNKFIELVAKDKYCNVFVKRKHSKQPYLLKNILPKHYWYKVVSYKKYKDHFDVVIDEPY